jgi:inosine-uridine nucleoside N-ribohydrolase
MHDPVALMSVIEPELLQQVGQYHVDVVTGEGLTVGRSVIDTRVRNTRSAACGIWVCF